MRGRYRFSEKIILNHAARARRRFERGHLALEHIPIKRKRDVLQILALAHILVGKQVSTLPGYAQAE
jgi:hypothetical protein